MRKMKKGAIIGIVISIILIIVVIAFFVYKSLLGPVGKESEEVTFKINAGQSSKLIIDNLDNAELIKNKYAAYIYLKLHDGIIFQAGSYTLNRNMSVEEIFEVFNAGKVISNTVMVTFKEGQRLIDYVGIASDELGFDYKEALTKINDEEYLKSLVNSDAYWFLTEEILNEDIYYGLEGYLFPDTYEFEKGSTIENVVSTMLSNTSLKLEPYKDELLNSEEFSVHEFLTIASILEGEGSNSDDRKKISQSIYNRLNYNDILGMDATSKYGALKYTLDNDSDWLKYLYDVNPYNTRVIDGSMNGKLPVGPICNPSLNSVIATLNPIDDYYWFVANLCTGEVFFYEYEDENGFYNKCAELRNVCSLN